MPIAMNRSGVVLHGIDTTNSREGKSVTYGCGGEGGILTQPHLPSYHVFSNMHEHRMDIADFYGLACFNSFNSSA